MRGRWRSDEAGQALAEYGIVLAIVGGLTHLQYYATDLLANPRKTLLVGIALGVGFFFLTARRR